MGFDDPFLIGVRAEVLFELGINDLSLEELQRAFAMGYNGPRANVAFLQSVRGPFESAIGHLNHMIENGDKDPARWMRRAMVYDKLSEFEKSMADYQYAIAHLKQDSPANLAPKFVEQRIRICNSGVAEGETQAWSETRLPGGCRRHT